MDSAIKQPASFFDGARHPIRGDGRSLGQARQYIRGCDLECDGNVDELNDIDPSFPVLIFGDERLRLAKSGSNIGLRHTPVLAGFDEQGLEKPLSWRTQGLRHSERRSIEKVERFR
ncbi:hypothetical protein GGR11_000753 [Brevundimonas mediterranea]|uniref:Uncharacterized protein n=1 Tax=Brevundimonas mediterranea TaxID=74329 RepID=A0A7W6EYY0_9CAUL|nr:hypothetical protein [Brevundimonas mediterranea]MBB3871239.1 hypothetical protein [Brevundimonas mediterranea]